MVNFLTPRVWWGGTVSVGLLLGFSVFCAVAPTTTVPINSPTQPQVSQPTATTPTNQTGTANVAESTVNQLVVQVQNQQEMIESFLWAICVLAGIQVIGVFASRHWGYERGKKRWLQNGSAKANCEFFTK